MAQVTTRLPVLHYTLGITTPRAHPPRAGRTGLALGLALVATLATFLPARADLPFSEGFETGNVCAWTAVPVPLWYPDGDGDGSGDPSGSSVAACAGPTGSGAGGDCDDSDPFVHPDAVELCDGADSDCDGNGDPVSCGGSVGFVRVVAVGDVACSPSDPSWNGGVGTATTCRQLATSDLAIALAPDAVLPLGDLQYDFGELANFNVSYAASWGRPALYDVSFPAVGNHEYFTTSATGYYTYFQNRFTSAGLSVDPAKGWYAFDLGGWHFNALNSNCRLGVAPTAACAAGSEQVQWLAADLAAHTGGCKLAYWHHPRFSSGPHGNDGDIADTARFWDALYAAGADLILAGHDHGYERFAPMSPSGQADDSGPRAFVVGTGGRSHTAVEAVRAQSAVRNYSTFGVLELTLFSNGYGWRFVPEPGGSFTDVGSALCHSAAP